MHNEIKQQIIENIELKKSILLNDELLMIVDDIANSILATYKRGNILLLCGNGGSAGDAQHLAGEMVGRFKIDRRALPAIALNTNTSIITAIGNDYEYNKIFERQVEAFGRKGDILLAISTSGNSENIIRAIEYAKKIGIYTTAFLGKDGGKCKSIADLSFVVPCDDTPRIQEIHIMIGHIICDIVEKELFKYDF